MRLVGLHDLAGSGECGEGISLQVLPGGRRILYIAHVQAPKDFSVVDVTDPARPRLLHQRDLPHLRMRSNSLTVYEDVLLVTRQVHEHGLGPAGVEIFDVRDPETPRSIGMFDASGPGSAGSHTVWFVDGRYAHVSSGTPDSAPTHPKDDLFYVILDMADPARPTEVGRWCFPGTQKSDGQQPPPRILRPYEYGYKVHDAHVYPQRPDRAYIGHIDGGVVILDISDRTRPQRIGHVQYHPPFCGSSHTVLPLFGRDLLVVADESSQERAIDWPTPVWVMDMREERNPVIVSTCPMPPVEDFAERGGRYGGHQIWDNVPLPAAWSSERYVVGAFYNGGIRMFDLRDPYRPEETAHYVPPTPARSTKGATQMTDVYVDERGLVYAIDRGGGGLYILETGLAA